MSELFWLSQAQFERIKPYFPPPRGQPRIDDLRIVSGIIHVIRNGLEWKDAPPEYGSYKQLYFRFIRWSGMGIFNSIFAELAAEDIPPDDRLMIDATHLESQPTAARLLKAGIFPAVSAEPGCTFLKIYLHQSYTTVGLETELQNVLKEIAEVEGCSLDGLCTAVYDLKKLGHSFAAALRIFIVDYYRSKSKSVLKNEVSQVLDRIRVRPSGNKQNGKPKR